MNRKRITVTISDGLYATLEGLSARTGEAKHKVLSDMLAPCEAVLGDLLACLVQAEKAREMVIPALNTVMGRVSGLLVDAQTQAEALRSHIDALDPGKDEAGGREAADELDTQPGSVPPY